MLRLGRTLGSALEWAKARSDAIAGTMALLGLIVFLGWIWFGIAGYGWFEIALFTIFALSPLTVQDRRR